uniref:Hybrid Arabinose isomerase n=1 Tax=Alicyclobacillus sp. TP7 TaxID=1202714 RepID=UPI0013E64885|nr:Chain A, Hybrid Arabinose isomerase [synthetic construct]7CHL_B Chain B, Hybrid Arabinose isomerase [synthetic construct]7CHL_C Chain C, Hybrid Arabinose isomerase [synthetic construct]7CHL_D Chain D, Hybrid Arabinose isomerase [synthetic construct]7CHL_E Chain E, Hybrid Arabinose isomerase [synthetic construct]7CHL_F Chain F, Hybrid Arabinose isomerase [synthetic construct]7CHL_G Chain G, Hybrid Arabinose isomerase [synthetic construct]7CHL_H Chain H, Hybrid Arabinose isomerase [syntheti
MKMPAYEFWFVVGSQHLYGDEALAQVEAHAREMVPALQAAVGNAHVLRWKGVLKDADEIRRLCLEASADDVCAGVIAWMHTFSPAKMWIRGLLALRKPLLHLHTQFNRDIPWDTIDMDFMNLNQSAHGDREYGFIGARMGVARKVVVGHWEDPEVRERLAKWMRTAVAFAESRNLKVARFGDNMREVAVTEGDKVGAQIQFGWSVNGYGIGDLVQYIRDVSEQKVNELLDEYEELYDIVPAGRQEGPVRESIREQARIELGLKAFLQDGNFTAFTTTFEDLHGLKQLPGLAVQRLMQQGYGFAGEGDWKTAALLRIMKVMSTGLQGGTSFMEDYTYHFEKGNDLVLGSHMLEVCPSIAAEEKPILDVQHLGIGGKDDPARLVFDGGEGAAVNASLIDLGHRFRLIVNEVDAVKPEHDMPKLPVARILWKPRPSLRDSAEAWILAGGAHHTCFSFAVTTEQLQDFAEMAGIECVVINEHTSVSSFKNELKWNEVFWRGR